MNVERSIANLVDWLVAHGLERQKPREVWLATILRQGHQECSGRGAPCRSCRVASALHLLIAFEDGRVGMKPEVDVCRALAPNAPAASELAALRAMLPAIEHRARSRGPIPPRRTLAAVEAVMATADALLSQMHELRGALADDLPHRELTEPPARAARPLVLRDVEYELRCGGFKATEISKLIDDGLGGTKKARIDRINKRRDAFRRDEVTQIDSRTAVGHFGPSLPGPIVWVGERRPPDYRAPVRTLAVWPGALPFVVYKATGTGD